MSEKFLHKENLPNRSNKKKPQSFSKKAAIKLIAAGIIMENLNGEGLMDKLKLKKPKSISKSKIKETLKDSKSGPSIRKEAKEFLKFLMKFDNIDPKLLKRLNIKKNAKELTDEQIQILANDPKLGKLFQEIVRVHSK